MGPASLTKALSCGDVWVELTGSASCRQDLIDTGRRSTQKLRTLLEQSRRVYNVRVVPHKPDTHRVISAAGMQLSMDEVKSLLDSYRLREQTERARAEQHAREQAELERIERMERETWERERREQHERDEEHACLALRAKLHSLEPQEVTKLVNDALRVKGHLEHRGETLPWTEAAEFAWSEKITSIVLIRVYHEVNLERANRDMSRCVNVLGVILVAMAFVAVL
jgi:hypothetical protein